MPLVFIPATDVSTVASQCQTFADIDLAYVLSGESRSFSFRLGNIGSDAIDWTLTSSDPSMTVSQTSGSIQPDECSDTLTATVEPALTATTRTVFASILATSGEFLSVIYASVGVNEPRAAQWPDRASPLTDLATVAIDKVGEPIRLYRFDPVAYDPADRRIVGYARLGLQTPPGALYDLTTQDEQAFNPLCSEWGYTRTSETIVASFQNEEETIRDAFTTEDHELRFDGGCSLLVPADVDLSRQWALLSPATEYDKHPRYKRTVFLFIVQKDIYCITQVFPRSRGNEYIFQYCRCKKVHPRMMGSPDELNPFAYFYLENEDKPYGYLSSEQFPVDLFEDDPYL